MFNETDFHNYEQKNNSVVPTNSSILRHWPTFFKDWIDTVNIIVSSVIGFFLAILLGYGLYRCFLTYSFCHADDKMNYPRNDYRFLPSCIRKKNRARRDTIVSYPSTRSGLNRLEQELDRLDKLEQELDQELKRELVRLNEPLKGFARLKQKFAKKTPVLVEQKLHVVQIDEPLKLFLKSNQTKRFQSLFHFFQKKPHN